MVTKFNGSVSARRMAGAGVLALGLSAWSAPGADAGEIMTQAGPMTIQLAVMGLNMPWSFEFLPVEGMLIGEKQGRLMRIMGGHVTILDNVPQVADLGQGGLLDVLVPHDYEETHKIFLSYSVEQGDGEGTALASATLRDGATALEDVQEIFEMEPGTDGRQHFGSRLAEAPDGSIFMTIGDRGDSFLAQDLTQHAGKVIRVNRDGSVPADNPFLDRLGARPEIWSLGHRDPQGAAVDPEGRLWITEHGPRGGDEVNLVSPGGNYGWPLVSYGLEYAGGKLDIGQAMPGMEQPVVHWEPPIAPSDIAFYAGGMVPDWEGDAFVGSLRENLLVRLSGETMDVAEQISAPETKRVRDVAMGPDGALWFLSETNGALYRIVPDTP